MKRHTVRCSVCKITRTTRDKHAYCKCTTPPTRMTPLSVALAVERVLGVK